MVRKCNQVTGFQRLQNPFIEDYFPKSWCIYFYS